eukprot:CAMPEP_0178973662 /NCGR_PEP_ID=MMETSP0789-20121207/21879_1 /TAXON_ID=3005 /ORGANISM="Rhizosolenia setigera, Strain CCMP 1694" /LENGTH=422 /DNA_ID=CAMNT_0020661617 /DNA_START=261 /DNA_END=1526 /DNA_ORIENTATION=-
MGSGIGSDSSMVASNDRITKASMVNNNNNNNNITKRFFTTSMEDEYGEMTDDGFTYTHPKPFVLESGEVLEEASLRYQTYGTLDPVKRDNVIVVCHALTGNASLHAWWGALLGKGLAFDTSKYLVVCANILGSSYGSTSPTSLKPNNSQRYGMDFPEISIRDNVRIQLSMLKDELKVKQIKSVIGGSCGGMQALEYGMVAGTSSLTDLDLDLESPTSKIKPEISSSEEPFLKSMIPIACGAQHTAWQIAISECQRQAIYSDPKWNGGDIDWDDPPNSGLSIARQIGMVSYRSRAGYHEKFGRQKTEENDSGKSEYEVKSYLKYQGEKFLSRFDPVTYLKLTEQIDTHDIGRNRGGIEQALQNCKIPSLILGIESDVLYPVTEQEELHQHLPNSELHVIHSNAGHDGFLLEQDEVNEQIVQFL